MAAFDVREGNGRLKNNLLVDKHQPPNMLVSVIVRTPGAPPIVGEIQVHHQRVLDGKKQSHRLYTIARADAMSALRV